MSTSAMSRAGQSDSGRRCVRTEAARNLHCPIGRMPVSEMERSGIERALRPPSPREPSEASARLRDG